MTQPRQYVAEDVVRGLVDAYLASGHSHCSSFRPDAMRAVLAEIPVRAFWDGKEQGKWIAYHEAAQIVLWFECHKMTASCNDWTPWMLDRLKKAKKPIAKEFLP
jgi:hypothetical protein